MVHLPLDAVRVFHPELVLVGVAAVDPQLFGHREPDVLDPRQLRHHRLDRVHLDAHVVDGAGADGAARREGEIDRRPFRQKLHVPRLDLDRVRPQELLVELPALGEI